MAEKKVITADAHPSTDNHSNALAAACVGGALDLIIIIILI